MTIAKQNVKLMASERLTDYEDGGGMMSPNEIQDGVVNNLFPDISRLDRVYGRVSLRKAFLSVQTSSNEMFYGAHAIVTDPPNDDTVTVTIFSTESTTDVRTDAKNRVESYLNVSVESRYRLFGNHLAGQRAVQVFADTTAPDPTIGATMVMRQMTSASNGTLVREQYVRVQNLISRENRTFTDSGSSFVRAVLSIEISAPLEADYSGAEPSRTVSSPALCKLHETIVADAANYYGVAKVAVDADAGATKIRVPSLFAQLVPSAQTESPVIDVSAAGENTVVIAAGAADAMTLASQTFSAGVARTFNMPRPIVPGSFRMTGANTATGFDDANGGYAAGSFTATINYATGTIAITANTNASGVTLYAQPGAAVAQAGITGSLPVTAENRSYNWVVNLKPLPSPGSFYADFMAQGKWYRLRDNGKGQLAGSEVTHGSGTINYATGSVIVTTGALPDVGTQILYGWGTGNTYQIETPAIERAIKIALGHAVEPSTFAMSVTLPTGTLSIGCNTSGEITGTGVTGYVNLGTGDVVLRTSKLPTAGAAVSVTSESIGVESLSQAFAVSTTLTPHPIKPGTVKVNYQMTAPAQSFNSSNHSAYADEATLILQLRDTGGGTLIDKNGTTRGTINYTTGLLTLDDDATAVSTRLLGFPQSVYTSPSLMA